jgi:hypothetical protein
MAASRKQKAERNKKNQKSPPKADQPLAKKIKMKG